MRLAGASIALALLLVACGVGCGPSLEIAPETRRTAMFVIAIGLLSDGAAHVSVGPIPRGAAGADARARSRQVVAGRARGSSDA